MRTPLYALLLLNLIFGGGVVYPWLEDLAPVLSGAALIGVWGASRWEVARRGAARLSAPFRRGAPLRAVLAITSLIVLVGALEYGAQIALRLGAVRSSGAMETLVPKGTADYRLAHIVGDRRREPDPLLWWRPSTRAPYNAQRMKGPIAALPKAPSTFRVLCYGDSNTDGNTRESWPELLHARLRVRGEIEVLNAGVAGYSSHQGLLRFQGDVDRFQPDLVLVSFGWNDATPAARVDHEFVPPHPVLIAVERVLIRFDFFRLLRRAHRSPPGSSRAPRARVPLDRYLENLSRFADEAATHESAIVFLTRPFREPLSQNDSSVVRWPAPWIAQVPVYNAATLTFGATEGLTVLDVHRSVAATRRERFADMAHWNEAGRAAMARYLEEELDARGLLP